MDFNNMSINSQIKMALDDMGFDTPTPIQEKVIPLMLENKDVIAQAPTGTGKTCAFGIPVINNIDLASTEVQALILCPTRELVIQTENELKEVAKYSREIKIVSIYGGQNFDRQLAGLRKKPQIIIGTTGRIMDHMRRKSLRINDLKILILDEVDEMLDMGFREDIDVILEAAPSERQTVLFSATMPKGIVEISKLYQTNPISIKTQHDESDIPNINQYYINVSESEKVAALVSVMNNKKYGLVLVFCNTKKRVDELNTHMNSLGINADALHGDLRQHNRDKTMKKFRSGETRMLIATDVAARGIDVDNIEAVFNFDIPHDEEYYVHRIGRTARASKTGDAYTFASQKQMYAIKNFENYTKNIIIKAELGVDTFEKSIDKKLFDKTLKIVKRGDLTTYKEFLTKEHEAFIQKYDEVEILDIAAALLLQLNEMNSSKGVVLSEAPKLAMKDNSKKRAGNRDKDCVRFFMNIGTRDKCDALSITKFIATNAGIAFEDILSVNCLENFSFANITLGNNEAMDSLNGLKYGKRIVAVEVASNDREKSPQREKSQAKEKSPLPPDKRSYKKGGNKKSSDKVYSKDGSKRQPKREDKGEGTFNSFKKSSKNGREKKY